MLQTISGKKDSDTSELTTQPNTRNSFRKFLQHKFGKNPIQFKANAVFHFFSSDVRKRGSVLLPYNTPKQTSNKPYQTIPSGILQDGFHHVRSYYNTRTATEQHKQRIYSNVNNKQYPLTPKNNQIIMGLVFVNW